MNVTERRKEILSRLLVKRHMTVKQLSNELDVTTRTIIRDIHALSYKYPIYTKPGVTGGIYMDDDYTPYCNSLTEEELQILEILYKTSEENIKPIILQIIVKYGPYKYSV